MNNKKMIFLTLALFALLLTSACGTGANNGSATDTVNTKPAETVNKQPTETNQENTTANGNDSTNSHEQILIIIDQTPKPIEGNSFDFGVSKVPEGYALAEM